CPFHPKWWYHNPLSTPETQAWSQYSHSLKTTPTTAPGLDRYLANHLNNLWPSPPPATATSSIPLAITAMTTTSAPALAITPPMTATSAPALATPDALLAHAETPIMHHDHASPPN
ncbi:hypothetical protein C0993_002721, partial [Termitomyces sp. T159_Od127]